jgi:hypothetical protein
MRTRITANIPAAEHGYRLQVNVEGVTTKSPLTVESISSDNRYWDSRQRRGAGDRAGREARTGLSSDAARRGTVTQSFAVRVNFLSGDARLHAVYATRLPAARSTP